MRAAFLAPLLFSFSMNLAGGDARAEAARDRAPRAGSNAKLSCGCPTPRLLQRGPAVLDGTGTVAAWLHDGARLEAFLQDPGSPQRLTAFDAPLVVQTFVDATGERAQEGGERLVRAYATEALPDGVWLGVLRRADVAPRDVVRISGDGARAPPTVGVPPALSALWLLPLEQRERPGCGSWLTHRIAFESVPGAPAPEAFLVADRATGDTALVDVRYAGVFGLGRIDACGQGLPFAGGAATDIEVRPVSASFGIGEPWRFGSDGAGTADVVRRASPSTADPARIAAPFPVPGEPGDQGPSLKQWAAFVMSGGVVASALFALVTWVIIPARKRRMQDVRCPACHSSIPVDALDPHTDGFFCPSCGASGFWKGSAAQIQTTVLGPSTSAGAVNSTTGLDKAGRDDDNQAP